MSSVGDWAAYIVLAITLGALAACIKRTDESCVAPAVKVEERVVNSELVKDCEFSDPCQFRSIHDYRRDVIALKTDLAMERAR